jgi:uncharacterized membrane protein YqgA involved in biofilm formation
MIATLVNAAAVIVGSLFGLLLHDRIRESFKAVIYAGAGIATLVIGMQMALQSTKIVYLALSLIFGGIIGEWLRIEGGVLRLGEVLKKAVVRGDGRDGTDFAYGFLDASVLFCVGAMALIGSFRAGAEGDYSLILTKSVMDGFMAIVLTAALGVGVAFSAVTILVYQGALTLLASSIKPLVSDVLLKELTGVGGALVLMIGVNLLGLAKLKTANFLPALLLIVLCVVVEGLLAH